MTTLSILDYSPVDEGSNDQEALRQTVQMAIAAEQLGYHRFWVSEHHHLPPLAGSNPEMLMMHLADRTHSIRIGSGGVMLPNYSAYKVAENFRMLEALHPGRIDLGAGRAAGAGRIGRTALNEGRNESVSYEQQLADLIHYLHQDANGVDRFPGLIATPQIDTQPELWLLGTGNGSAELAATYGTALAFAHFIHASDVGPQAAKRYRREFQPSEVRKQPYTMVGIFISVADTEEEAQLQALSWDYWLLMSENKGLRKPGLLPPEQLQSHVYTEEEQNQITARRERILIGTPHKVRARIERLAARYEADEVLILPLVYGFHNRMRMIQQLAKVFEMGENAEKERDLQDLL
ncbi:LLM class flavin-dependent oxidoreductase [Paenibacillus sp. WLX2291]|uniref:LLM class flavin-dependent oxidoreductase n=1 Tax=Paenibacillus sp. WLX2291 TaxID=3296934 RepID=UPI003984277A